MKPERLQENKDEPMAKTYKEANQYHGTLFFSLLFFRICGNSVQAKATASAPLLISFLAISGSLFRNSFLIIPLVNLSYIILFNFLYAVSIRDNSFYNEFPRSFYVKLFSRCNFCSKQTYLPNIILHELLS